MTADGVVGIVCVCGHGDDGRHTAATVFGVTVIGCPAVPPERAWRVEVAVLGAPEA